MQDTHRHRCRAVVLCALCALPSGLSAQTLGGTRPQMTAPRERGVLTAFRTTLDLSRLVGSGADGRFNWDADLRLDVDLFDVGAVRGNLLANLETIIGSELREIDPNQNNYVVDFALFVRLPRGEIAGTFHHVSRHLGDRADQGSVSWNMAGVSYGDRFTIGPLRVEAGGRAMATVERANVDYAAQFEWFGDFELPLNPRISIIGAFEGVVVPVELDMLMRTTRRGGRATGGVRFPTGVGSVDLYAGWEKRIDAGQFTRETPRWFQLGLRLRAPMP